jgi:hypothetical protein
MYIVIASSGAAHARLGSGNEEKGKKKMVMEEMKAGMARIRDAQTEMQHKVVTT